MRCIFTKDAALSDSLTTGLLCKSIHTTLSVLTFYHPSSIKHKPSLEEKPELDESHEKFFLTLPEQ